MSGLLPNFTKTCTGVRRADTSRKRDQVTTPFGACKTFNKARRLQRYGSDEAASRMKISEFREMDRQAVLELWQVCQLTVPWNNPDQDIDRKVAHSPEHFWVGHVGGELMASVMFGYDGHRGSVNYLAVAPRYQGEGYGRMLMERIEQQMKGWGCPKINLAVRSSNTAVLAFYDSLGYRTDAVANLGKRLEQDQPY
jgi:ribosomal protein S18 acetylase RimI-like enzyme